ncbi:hypothetical protein ABPG74_011137 [Tetrahymena malaccensis]
MSKSALTILFLVLFSVQVQAQLKFVLELYRHGARTPINSWYDADQQKADAGELTATGQRQHYNLGLKLREEYRGFIPDHYNHSEIYVRSTDVNRTLMSAASHVQGMFPQYTGNQLPSNLSEQYTLPYFKDAQNYLPNTLSALPSNIQVLPIHTQLEEGDIVLQPDSNCDNYSKLKKAFYAEKQDTINFINQQFSNTYQQYSIAVNKTVKNFDDMHSLESTFECDRYNARYVPYFSFDLRENATFLTSLSWNFQFGQPELLRALNTPFLNQLLAYLNPVVQGKNKNGLKWVMFSAHDTNVHLISAALNFTSIDCLLNQRFPDQFKPTTPYYNCEQYPHFTASLLFELHQANQTFTENGVQVNDQQFYLKIRRDGKFMNLCETNSTVCTIEEFSKRVNWFVNDFNAVCNQPTSKNISNAQMLSAARTQQIVQTQNLVPINSEKAGSSSTNYYFIALIIQQIVIIIGGYAFYKSKQSKKTFDFQEFKDIEVGVQN